MDAYDASRQTRNPAIQEKELDGRVEGRRGQTYPRATELQLSLKAVSKLNPSIATVKPIETLIARVSNRHERLI